MLTSIRRSLAARILLALVLVCLLGFGAQVWQLYDSRDALRYSTQLIQATEIARGLTATSDLEQLPTHYAGGRLSYTLYSPEGEPVWHSANLGRPLRMRVGTLDEVVRPLQLRPFRGRGLNISVPVRLADGYTLIVAKDDSLERSVIDALLQGRLLNLLLAFLPFCLLAAGLIWWLLRWTLRPVREAAALAAEIHPSTLERRIPLERLPQEILPLAQAANLGLDRLADALVAQKQWLADAAHELRTPLTVLDLRLQKMQHEGKADWPAIEQEMQRVRHLVSQLLTLARHDHATQQPTGGPPLRLSRLTRETVASLIPLFEQAGRELEVEIDDQVVVKGDPEPVRDAIRNVVENALLHGGGTVRLVLRRAPAGGAVLEVADEGPGVTLDTQDDMFLRFRKGRQGSAGAGLGLAIARQALRQLGGDVRFVGNSPCVVRLTFPGEVSDEMSHSAPGQTTVSQPAYHK